MLRGVSTALLVGLIGRWETDGGTLLGRRGGAGAGALVPNDEASGHFAALEGGVGFIDFIEAPCAGQ